MATPTLNLLDIGISDSPANDPMDRFKGFDINLHTMDIDPSKSPTKVHDIRQPPPEDWINYFDIIFCSHTLEHIEAKLVLNTLLNIDKMLRVTGELYIMVPSLDWFATETVAGRNSPIYQSLIFGSQTNEWEYHKSGYTLNVLRILVETHLGYIIRRAYQSPFVISFVPDDGSNLQMYNAMQSIIIGLKYKEREEVAKPDILS